MGCSFALQPHRSIYCTYLHPLHPSCSLTSISISISSMNPGTGGQCLTSSLTGGSVLGVACCLGWVWTSGSGSSSQSGTRGCSRCLWVQDMGEEVVYCAWTYKSYWKGLSDASYGGIREEWHGVLGGYNPDSDCCKTIKFPWMWIFLMGQGTTTLVSCFSPHQVLCNFALKHGILVVIMKMFDGVKGQFTHKGKD